MHADAIFGNTKLHRHEDAQRLRYFTVKFDADHLTAASAFQGRLEQANEVFRLFLHFNIAVADDAERTGAAHLITGE
ncbi:Uncharacterised protein [Brucella melitensis]|nr:Uncharacterised protein [Brucella melitensis]